MDVARLHRKARQELAELAGKGKSVGPLFGAKIRHAATDLGAYLPDRCFALR